MNTWAAYATAHASLTSGISAGPGPAFGSASLYGFALGASATVLALVVIRSPRQLNLHWRPADLWRCLAKLAQARDRRTRPAPSPLSSRSRIRQRVDLILLQMLGDDVDEHSQSCPAATDGPIAAADAPVVDDSVVDDSAVDESAVEQSASAASTRGYRSKHRLAAPPKDLRNGEQQKQEQQKQQRRKRNPRHAASSATLVARITNAKTG